MVGSKLCSMRTGTHHGVCLSSNTAATAVAAMPPTLLYRPRCCAARSYILDAIDSSVDMINDGIIMLQEAAPNPKLFPQLQKLRVSSWCADQRPCRQRRG